MMLDFVTVNGKKFRKGYTTGSCAAAASKAAVMMLLSGRPVENVTIDTPAGIVLNLDVTDAEAGEGWAGCAVVKDGGDDPDLTSGLKIFARARFCPGEDILVSAGEGIGRVTLPGLKVEVGKPAINPVPMKMLLKEVREVMPAGKGVCITLSVPGGEEVAKKTYNPRLGIVGGISILGTSGIVTPMSEEAWKESVALELSIAKASGKKDIAYTFGNYGESFAVNQLGIDRDRIIKISNFVGFMLDKALECGVERILLVGHMGKLVKVAAGVFHTHSRIADARMETLAAFAALSGASREIVEKIYLCRTTDAAAGVIQEYAMEGIYQKITESASNRCMQYVFHRIKIGTVLFNEENTLLSMDEGAREILNGTWR